jgi:2-C-methyl-D-erythritol 4-phosphate cytidylyltransferase
MWQPSFVAKGYCYCFVLALALTTTGEMKKYVVIVAGGKGVRMGNAVPKQFLPLCGKPILTWTIEAFLHAFSDAQIILVLPEGQLSYGQIVLYPLPERTDVTIVIGGETRFHSVQNGLNTITEPGIVFVHDGARPLVSVELIKLLYTAATEHGTAIPALPAYESLRQLTPDGSEPLDRSKVRIIQTPQVFHTKVILPAFQQAYQESFTDEATVVEKNGTKVHLVPGEKTNIKITEPQDLLIAEAFIAARKD